MQNRKIKASFSVLGGFLTHIVLGVFYLWGNLTLYATSYFRYNGYENLQKSSMQAVSPFIVLGTCISHFFGVPIARRFGHKITSSITIIVYASSIFAASKSNFIWFVITMGFVPGLCIGIEYLIPVDNAVNYYPEKKGKIYGLILCGLGFSSLVFIPLFQYFINPNNVSPNEDGYYPEEVANNLPEALFKFCWIYLAIGLSGALMMFQVENKFKTQILPKNKNQISDVEKLEEKLLENQNQINQTLDLFSYKQLYFFWVIFYLISGFGLMMASQYKTYGVGKIKNDDDFISNVGTIGGSSNGISRFFWSALLDYISPNKLLFINMSMMIVLAVTFNLVATYKTCFMIWMILIYFQYGGIFTYFPTVCAQTFGEFYGPYAYNIIYTAVALSNFTQFFLTQQLVEKIQYEGIFYIYGGFGLLGMIVLVIMEYSTKTESLINVSKQSKEEVLEILSQY